MTIPTDGRIDLDALAELQAWLLKRAQPNSGLRYERYGDGLARVEFYGGDATFVADHFHSKGAKKLADAIDRARRAAIPSEQGEAVLAEVAAERRKQVEKHGWSSEHDDTHTDGSLALAAIAYVMPERLYRMVEYAAGPHFVDPWPDSWADGYDRRYGMGERRTNPGNMPPDPATYTVAERRKLLIKGLAMLVAEVERIDRASALDQGEPK